MKRRESVLALIAVGAAALMSDARAQGKVWRVGVLSPRHRPDSMDTDLPGAFLRGMRELGYVEGWNLVIEWRFADGKSERLPDLAVELVQLKVDVIVCGSSQGIRALQHATTTIPIVMATSGDPVGSGFVASLARPGGNITGLSNLLGDIGPKQLELLLGIVPNLSRVAMFVNPVNPANATNLKNAQSAAQKVNVRVVPVEIRSSQEIESAFSMMTRERTEAVIVTTDAIFIEQRRQIVQLATKLRLPSISGMGEFTEAGGLMSYGPNFPEQYRRAATFVDKILKGAKPGDLPVEQPATFEFFINNKTAKSLGLTIPQSMLLRADRVIE